MLSRYRDSLRTWTDPVGYALYRLRLRPNHLTLAGLGVSLLAASAFVAGRVRVAGVLLLLAGLFDFFDGSLARASRQVTPFGAFLDSVIDRYSDLVVLLGIVVLFARMPHTRGALVAMAGLVGTVMVSYTKARAESIGVECTVGMMERPERLICLIAGALLDRLEPALWVLAVLANLTALQRIVFTWRAVRGATILPALALGLLASAAAATPAADGAPAHPAPGAVSPDKVTAWARAVEEFQAGDPEALVREFSTEAALGSPIADYVRLLLADALSRRGDLAAARATAAAVAERHPDSRLAPGALIQAATLASLAGDEAGAQALLAQLLAKYPDVAEVPQALYLLGMTGEARGQAEAAAHAYRELTILAPASDWADGAADRLAALASAGVRAPEPSAQERLDRAERLLRGGVPQTAAAEAERLAAEVRDPSLAARALRVVADASARLGRYEVAARALDLATGYVPPARRPALRLEQARLLLRAGRYPQAVDVLRNLKTATEAEAAEAAWLRARALEEMDRGVEAAAAYRAVAARFPTREVAGGALWRAGWLAWQRGELRAAEALWLRVGEIPGGRAHRLAALYWAGRVREQVAGRAAAEQLYRRVMVEAPRSYYGVLAARRVTKPPVLVESSGHAPVRLPADPEQAIADDPGFVRVDLLRRIGLVEFAVRELDAVLYASVGDPLRLYGISGAYARDERYHLALRILRRHFSGLAASGHPDLPRAFWEMLYPFPWREEVVAEARQAAVDPFLVAAVIREESSYHPRALSRAGARGLMQIMPGTAQPMAEVRGLPFQDGDLLDDPRANVHLGTSYLAALLREFIDPRLALAAYNAGPARVRQWWQGRRTNDLEAFVELIPFDETRQYVKRVMLSWEEYRRIYGSPAPPRDWNQPRFRRGRYRTPTALRV
jgi:soluble lytic murein transglycosylase